MKSNDHVYIAKPYAVGRGEGIFVFKTLEEYDSQKDGDDYVIQRYFDKPHIILNRKWDI